MDQHELIEGLFEELETIAEYLKDSYTYHAWQAADRIRMLVDDTRQQLGATYSEFQYLADLVS